MEQQFVEKNQTFGITSLVCGILSLMIGLVPYLNWFVGFPLALASIICGILAWKRKQAKDLSLTGMILSSLSIFAQFIILLLFICHQMNGMGNEQYQMKNDYLEEGHMENPVKFKHPKHEHEHEHE